jgi:hypothetical protein
MPKVKAADEAKRRLRLRYPASADMVSFRFLLSELLWDASLLQYRIGRVAGQNLVVDGKAALRDGAVPDFVIPATGAFKSAPVSTKNFL